MTDAICTNDGNSDPHGDTTNGAHRARCLLEVPFFGPLPAFLYPDLINSRSLAIGDSVAFYVYILRRPAGPDVDRAGEAFYVGKGSNRRYTFHYTESNMSDGYSTSANKHKIHTIRKVGRDQVLVQMIPCESEVYANDLECKLIAHWGRRKEGSGVLTNQTSGGEGVSGVPMPLHVLDHLSQLARQPVKFNGKVYPGITDAFNAHNPDEIAIALRVDRSASYCHDYATFKAWYGYWAQQDVFPAGFNYIEDGQPLYLELSWEKLAERTRQNRKDGYAKAWETRYAYPRFVVNGTRYHTLSDAAEKENVGTPSNIAALFRRMVARDHFSPGFNILDENGNNLYQERNVTLQQVAREEAGRALAAQNAKPVIVNDVCYATIEEGFKHATDFAKLDYFAFASQVARYETARVFPEGLNIPDEDGNPKYPEIDPSLLGGTDLGIYVKVQDRLFCSMRQASLYFGKSHGTVQSWFSNWANAKDNAGKPLPFPKGFNVYRTVDQHPLHEDMSEVDCRVPASGYLYHHRVFKQMAEIDAYRGSKRGTTSALFCKRRKLYLKNKKPFDAFLNVLGLDGSPLYPVDLATKISVPIARAGGSGHRLHNGARAILIKAGDDWRRFDSLADVWRSNDWLRSRYENSESFASTIRSQRKSGHLPDWIQYADE